MDSQWKTITLLPQQTVNWEKDRVQKGEGKLSVRVGGDAVSDDAQGKFILVVMTRVGRLVGRRPNKGLSDSPPPPPPLLLWWEQ